MLQVREASEKSEQELRYFKSGSAMSFLLHSRQKTKISCVISATVRNRMEPCRGRVATLMQPISQPAIASTNFSSPFLGRSESIEPWRPRESPSTTPDAKVDIFEKVHGIEKFCGKAGICICDHTQPTFMLCNDSSFRACLVAVEQQLLTEYRRFVSWLG